MNGDDLIEQVIEQPKRYQKRHRESVYQELRELKKEQSIGPRKPLIIAFGYKKRSGKDTAANFIAQNYGAYKLAFADPIKVAAMVTYGFSKSQVYGDKKEQEDDFWGVPPRTLLQYEGDELHRKKLGELMAEVFGDQQIWVRRLKQRIESIKRDVFVVPDLRYQNEAVAIKKMGGIIVKIDATERIGESSDGHESENSLNGFTGWDYIIDNNKDKEHFYQGLNTLIRDLRTSFPERI